MNDSETGTLTTLTEIIDAMGKVHEQTRRMTPHDECRHAAVKLYRDLAEAALARAAFVSYSVVEAN
jgi:hypothetical protein